MRVEHVVVSVLRKGGSLLSECFIHGLDGRAAGYWPSVLDNEVDDERRLHHVMRCAASCGARGCDSVK